MYNFTLQFRCAKPGEDLGKAKTQTCNGSVTAEEFEAIQKASEEAPRLKECMAELAERAIKKRGKVNNIGWGRVTVKTESEQPDFTAELGKLK